MALQGGHQAATKHDPVADVIAIRPGAFGVADGVEQGAALSGDREDPHRRWGQGQGQSRGEAGLRDPRGLEQIGGLGYRSR